MLGRKKQPTEPTADELLEQRVDAMMSVTEPKVDTSVKSPQLQIAPTDEDPKLPSLDIFAGTTNPVNAAVTSAPPLPGSKVKSEPATAVSVAEPAAVVQPEPMVEPVVEPVTNNSLDTPDTDAAIDDIVAQEADAVLAAEDAGLAAQQLPDHDIDDEDTENSHPVFWFFIYLFAGLIVVLAWLLFGLS